MAKGAQRGASGGVGSDAIGSEGALKGDHPKWLPARTLILLRRMIETERKISNGDKREEKGVK